MTTELTKAAQQACHCQTCRPITMEDMRMVLCPTCGNKRCPHANDHRNACTGSNEPGQPGSAYPASALTQRPAAQAGEVAFCIYPKCLTTGRTCAGDCSKVPTQPAAQATPEPGCTRSHPHENMSATCELRTEIARLRNENTRLKAATPKPFAAPGRWFPVDVLGNPMREFEPGKWEVALWPSATPEPVGEPIKYQPGEWYEAKDRDDLEAFFRSRLPAIREAAREHGYAIGLHGSMRRDLDLIAVPWRDGASDRDVLAHAIAMAACGITRDGPYEWEQKPLGRVAAILPCCWPRWFNEAGAGHIDLSVVDLTRPAPVETEPVGEPFGWWFTEDPDVFCMPGSGFRRYPNKPQHTVECIALYTRPAPGVTETDADALLDFMEAHRVSVTPEYEGQWCARQYDDEPQAVAEFEAATPRDAIRALAAAQAKGGA